MPWHELGISWTSTGQTVISATALYAAVILFSRLFGQRQFATSSTYDLAFIFALGTIIGRAVLVSIATGSPRRATRTLGSRDDVAAVILERNGDFTVIERGRDLDPEVFKEVVGRQHLR